MREAFLAVFSQFSLTWIAIFDKIEYTEGYRSGHNEAVLKTVCLHGRVSSNLTPSATCLGIQTNSKAFSLLTAYHFLSCYAVIARAFSITDALPLLLSASR